MKSVAFLILGTNKYFDLAKRAESSVYKWVKIPDTKINVKIFTNNDRLEHFHIDHLPWPLITLMRYHYFTQYAQELAKYDYLFYMDADLECVAPIGDEILGNLVATQHPGWWGQNSRSLPFCRINGSTAEVADPLYDKYFYGAFQGGSSQAYLEMSRVLRDNIAADLKHNFIAPWHDESHMNRYFKDNPPDVILGKDYAWPEEYGKNLKTKIVAKQKNHLEIRSEN